MIVAKLNPAARLYASRKTLLQRDGVGHKEPFPASWLRDADGVRVPEVEHVVQDPNGDGDPGVSSLLSPELCEISSVSRRTPTLCHAAH